MNVAGVDELTAVFGDLAAGPIAGAPAPPPHAVSRLEDLRHDARLVEPIRGRDPRETGAGEHGSRPGQTAEP